MLQNGAWRCHNGATTALTALDDLVAIGRSTEIHITSRDLKKTVARIDAGAECLQGLPERGLLAGGRGVVTWFDLHVPDQPVPLAIYEVNAFNLGVLNGTLLCAGSDAIVQIVVDEDRVTTWSSSATGLLATTNDGQVRAVASGTDLHICDPHDEGQRRQEAATMERRPTTRALVAAMYDALTSGRNRGETCAAFEGLIKEDRVPEAAALAASASRADFKDVHDARQILGAVAEALEKMKGDHRPLRDALVVVRDTRDTVECFDKFIAPLLREWDFAEFRDGDAMDYFDLAARANAIGAGRALWARYLRRRATTGTAEARTLFSRRFADRCASMETSLAFLEACVFRRDVVAVLRSGAVAILADFAADHAAREEEEADLDRAVAFADNVLSVLGDYSGGGTPLLWQQDVETEGVAKLKDLARRLRRVKNLREKHGVATTLATYEATEDKSTVATALLDRVRDPGLLGDEIKFHVRPISEIHGLDSDDVLLSYCEDCEPEENAGRLAAIVDHIRDHRKRARAALALIHAARPPYPESVFAVVDSFSDDVDESMKDVVASLADAARLAKLAHIAAVAKATNFDPGDPSQAPRLLRLIVRNATAASDLNILDDITKLADAYPATINCRDAVVQFALDLVASTKNDAVALIRGALKRFLPKGADRQCARRDIVRGCSLMLEEEDNNHVVVHEVGAAIGEDLVKENDVAVETDDFETRQARGLAEADAMLVDTVQRVAALYVEFGTKVTPSELRSRNVAVLETISAPLVERAIIKKGGGDTNERQRLARLADLLDAPPGWVVSALVIASKDTKDADALWLSDADPSKRAATLRDLAKWQLLRGGADLRSSEDAARRRIAAMRALAQAASLATPDSLAADATMLEIVRFLDAVADRCVETVASRSNDGLLLAADDVAIPVAAFLKDLFHRAGISLTGSDNNHAVDALCGVFEEHEAWRLQAQALAVLSAVDRGRCDAGRRAETYARQLRHRLLYVRSQEKDWLGRRFDAEAVAGLAAASGVGQQHKKVVVAAYREAVGAVSVSDLEALGDLARLGAAVAARLDDPRLKNASKALAVDALWWRLLRQWRVPFDHTRLRSGDSSHARELVWKILDVDDEKPLDPDRVAVVLALCERYGVPLDVPGAAAAVRVLARGSSEGSLQRAADLAQRCLAKIPVPKRRIDVLRSAIATADPCAFDRIDLAVRLLLDEHKAVCSGNDDVAAPRPDPENKKWSTRHVFAAPSVERLQRWRQLLRWLRSVRLDAAAVLGAEGARLLEEQQELTFHGVVAEPVATLEKVLVEATAPRLGRVARIVGLPQGALWIRLAERRIREGRIDDGWRCLDRAAEVNIAAAAKAATTLINEDAATGEDLVARVDLCTRASRLAHRWATEEPGNSIAQTTRHNLQAKRQEAARRAVCALLFMDDDLQMTTPRALLEELYRRAASKVAEDLVDGAVDESLFFAASRRAHAGARILARFETMDRSGDALADTARRELARAWIFDEADDLPETPMSVFSPSVMELRERSIAVAAVKIAFALSPTTPGRDDDDIQQLERRLLPPNLCGVEASQQEEESPVALLVALAAGDDEPSESSKSGHAWNDVEAGRRERLTPGAKLRALRAASILGPVEKTGLARKLRILAELAALRLPQARIIAARDTTAVVSGLLAEHGRDPKLAPTLLPLLAGLLLETTANDDDDVIPLWRPLLDAFTSHGLWRPLLAVFKRLAHEPWLHTWRADGIADIFRSALRRPADELLQSHESPHRRPLWPRNSDTRSQQQKRKVPPSFTAVAAVLVDVAALFEACPHFVRPDDRAHISKALNTLPPDNNLLRLFDSSDDYDLRIGSRGPRLSL